MSSEVLQGIISVALGNPDESLTDKYFELTEIEKVACRYYCCAVMTLGGAYKFAKESDFPEAVETEESDEKFLRNIENKVGISEKDSNDYRRLVMAFVGNLFANKKEICWDMRPDLAEAFTKYLKEQIEKN